MSWTCAAARDNRSARRKSWWNLALTWSIVSGALEAHWAAGWSRRLAVNDTTLRNIAMTIIAPIVSGTRAFARPRTSGLSRKARTVARITGMTNGLAK